jgi:hypothetical protein
MSKSAPAKKLPGPKPGPCTHESISFDPKSGTYYLTCSACTARWLAVGPNDEPRYEAMFQGYGVNEERRSLFYVKPAQRS